MSLERYWGMTYVVMRMRAELGHEMDVSNFVVPPPNGESVFFSFPILGLGRGTDWETSARKTRS